LLICSCFAAAQNSDSKAKAAVDKAAAKLQSGAFRTEIKIVQTAETGVKNSQNGILKIAGNKFYLKTDDFENFFDGKTQWVYMESLNEVTVSEPNKDELQTISPVFIIKNFEKKHRVAFDDNAPQDNFWHICLFPIDKKNDYFKIILTINKKNNEVKQFEIWQKNGEKLLVNFGVYNAITQENQTFTFQTKNYPKVIINDMR
jgi:outer membrane lipoprotein-sorting protein